MIFVETFEFVIQRVTFLVALRHQHREGVGDGIAGTREELQHVVERSAVAHTGLHDGADVIGDTAELIGAEQGFAGLNPETVASYCVDFPVVAYHPERLRKTPGREGIGGEARVHEGDGACEVLVRQVGKVAAQLQ